MQFVRNNKGDKAVLLGEESHIMSWLLSEVTEKLIGSPGTGRLTTLRNLSGAMYSIGKLACFPVDSGIMEFVDNNCPFLSADYKTDDESMKRKFPRLTKHTTDFLVKLRDLIRRNLELVDKINTLETEIGEVPEIEELVSSSDLCKNVDTLKNMLEVIMLMNEFDSSKQFDVEAAKERLKTGPLIE